MFYSLISKKTNKLSKSEIKNICNIKNTNWKFGIKSQLSWFKKNVKKNDIHNLLFINKKLIGYTALRNNTYFLNNIKKKYLLFDTLILNKNSRKLKLSYLLMNFNNEIIKQYKKPSFLIAKKKQIKFYNKFGWYFLKPSKVILLDHSSLKNCMVFNIKKILISAKFRLYINK